MSCGHIGDRITGGFVSLRQLWCAPTFPGNGRVPEHRESPHDVNLKKNNVRIMKHSGHGRIMQTQTRTKLLLFCLATCMLFSVIAVAYDYHDPSRSKTCPLCFMRGSLSTSLVQVCFLLQHDDHPSPHYVEEWIGPCWRLVGLSFVSFRGPPEEPSQIVSSAS
jgi:hypothetical protein